jgi:hypothetical protein
MSGLHFVPADRFETCHECGVEIKPNELMMPHEIREPRMSGQFTHTRVVECYACGLLLLESQDHPIDKG